MPPKATTASVSTPATPTVNVENHLKDASKNARESEVGDGPEGNWEVAYVYAFIDRFTELRKVEYGSPLKSVFDLEQALLSSSPPAKVQRKAALAATNKNGNDGNGNGSANGNGSGGGAPQSSASSLSSLSDDDDVPAFTPMPSNPNIPAVPPVLAGDSPIPPASETLVAIIECFKQNLMAVTDLNDYHGKKTWLTWLINFVGKRMNSSIWHGFRWEGNLLRTRGLKPGQEQEKMFWLLRWEDKIHLFRQLVDFQLCSSPLIREKITQGYDLGHQRNALRTQALNPLIVEPLGTTLSKRQVYHIDETPRLYSASSIPAKNTNSAGSSSNWATLASTSPGYKAFLLSLPEPAPAPGKKGAPGVKEPVKRTKGPKPGSKEDPKREERLIRGKLENGLEKMSKYEEAMAEIDIKERRVAARRADSDARLARNMSRMGTGSSTRSTRQKARPSYANDGIGEEDEVDELEEDDGGDEEMGRGKRRRIAAGNANEDDWETSSVASGSTVGRRGARKMVPPTIPGERRSSRVLSKLKDEGYEVGEDEVDELDEDGHSHHAQQQQEEIATDEAKPSSEGDAKVEEGENGTKVEGEEAEEEKKDGENGVSSEIQPEVEQTNGDVMAKEDGGDTKMDETEA